MIKPGVRTSRIDSSPLHGGRSDDLKGPETPESEDDDQSSPPSTKFKGKVRNATRVSSTPSQAHTPLSANADKNKKDKGLREFSLRVCRQVEVHALSDRAQTLAC